MKERPILFKAEMVRAILDGRKIQTRRVVKPKIIPVIEECFRVNGKWCDHTFDYDLVSLCPHGVPSDQLYTKETFRIENVSSDRKAVQVKYRAGGLSGFIECPGKSQSFKWTPSIHMPRAFSRIDLKIKDIRVERLQDISEEDAIAEGVERTSWPYSCEPYRNYNLPGRSPGNNYSTAVASFVSLWNSINSKSEYVWFANPWV